MVKPYFAATGKRKTAIARVKLCEGGAGQVTVNGRPIAAYFHSVYVENALSPFATLGLGKRFDATIKVEGGGPSAQSDAVRHGLSRALLLCNPEFRSDLKHAGFLRRDSRIKERKKPGLKRARRAPQWQKR